MPTPSDLMPLLTQCESAFSHAEASDSGLDITFHDGTEVVFEVHVAGLTGKNLDLAQLVVGAAVDTSRRVYSALSVDPVEHAVLAPVSTPGFRGACEAAIARYSADAAAEGLSVNVTDPTQ